MPEGAGKYDNYCTRIREDQIADAVMVAVVNGRFGSGFSVQAISDIDGRKLADVLEKIAAGIRADYDRMQGEQNG